ncbi:MAG: tetrathionate reductase family octaheme c-type cytochrome [Gammaproteobacteria bacterium]|nr:tetrathionate reductase family octaheme c-type cytochrome [Gammaproteobacteria bacterium]NNJ49854.1 tetrathionate reductase family octaheme c-type cytochrome [Gammaproteobacteria bacterium]
MKIPGSTIFHICRISLLFVLLSGSAYATTTADHTKFKQLQVHFNSGPDVTRTCIKCHTEAAKQIHKTKHWTWEFLNPQNKQRLGKKNIVNNFCITPKSNFDHCATCHVGYGWRDDTFDFSSEVNVDCLVCHDTTGDYLKSGDNAGHPKSTVDLAYIAQNVGKTSRDTCGACHFYGGGGNGVKHGDMDDSLAVPDRDLDVHMDAVGPDFTCSTCHKSIEHDVAGSRYMPDAKHTDDYHVHRRDYDEENNAHCRACHGNKPHKKADKSRLNHHANKIACQTCHIPEMSRGGIPTRMTWDWSTAGQLNEDGEPIERKVDGNLVYSSKRGTITYAENINPEYIWFNGKVRYQLLTEKVRYNDDGYVLVNEFEGSPYDGESRIWPVKVFRGVQPYDPVNQTLVVPHTTGSDKASYWKNFDWQKAVAAGMKSAGLPFSGEVDFVKTQMSWLINHMVTPGEGAVGCNECHSKNGRLKDIDGIYIPGRDADKTLDAYGWLIASMTLVGVILHGIGRIISYYWSKRK